MRRPLKPGWSRTARRTGAAGVLVGLVLGATGCDRAGAKKAIVLNPTTRTTPPVTTAATGPSAADGHDPATRPATTQAAKPASYMNVAGNWVEFREAKLILRKEGEKVVAFLTSNDDNDVLKPNYRGNRYYFELTLDTVDDPRNLIQAVAGAEFRYKASSAEPADTPNGVFLEGDRQHLQPFDIHVTFDRDPKSADRLLAQIVGQFLYFPKGKVIGEMVPVEATLGARPEVGK